MSVELQNEIDRIMHEDFLASQANLPPESRAAANPKDYCLNDCGGYKCTKVKGHTGNHVAHGSQGILFQW